MHTDIAPEPTCNRHPNRHGNPWCPPCSDGIRTALITLPDLHARLLDHDGIATRPRLIGGRTSIDPASPSDEFDHADEIARTLSAWAAAWADYLDEQITRERAWLDPVDDEPTLLPCCWAAAHRTYDRDLQAHAAYCPWRRYVEARGRSDAERRGLTAKPLTPRAAATYLNRHRRHADLLTSPLAEDLGTEIRALHARALRLLGGDETSSDPVHTPLPGICPACATRGLYRLVYPDRSENIHCRNSECGLDIGYEDYLAEYEHQQRQAGQIKPWHLAQRHLADSHTAA